jgi:putative membrane protein
MAQAPLREVPAHFLRGMAMGSADVVPGVSGGTVALVLAIYHRLITAIRTGS